MKVSIDPRVGDPEAFQTVQDIGERQVQVFLDDVEQSYVIYADEELGVVTRYQRDSLDRALQTGGELARETLHGRVEIKIRDRAH